MPSCDETMSSFVIVRGPLGLLTTKGASINATYFVIMRRFWFFWEAFRF